MINFDGSNNILIGIVEQINQNMKGEDVKTRAIMNDHVQKIASIASSDEYSKIEKEQKLHELTKEIVNKLSTDADKNTK